MRGNQQEDAIMFANFATAISSGTAITLALFYVMNMLITVQPGVIVEPREQMTLAWVRKPTPDEPLRTIQQMPKKEFIKPPVLPKARTTIDTENFTGYAVPPSAPTPSGKYHGPTSVMSDGPLVALVRVEPTYPARALGNGTEGYVVVRFDVLADGTVANVVVVESSNRVFEDAARKAASRFRFKPRVVDGIAQATSGVQNLFRFEMKK